MDARAGRLILTRSAPLRLLTLLLFYFTQGFPVGLFFYAVPAWMAVGGASTADVAAVVGMAGLPWTLKLVNGFLIDRYTFLPMGRRRAWIVGAQGVIVLVLLAGAVLSPDARDVLLLSAIGFAANMAVTFQDVGIDSLAVDIMAENERAKAAGIMFGAQMLGISAATALGGALLQASGFSLAMAVAALVPGAVMAFGVAIREREGERRLPWTAGESHAAHRAVQVEAWLPLLRSSFRAVLAPLSLVLLPILLVRALPFGGHEAFHPILVTGTAGWSLAEYTQLMSTVGLVGGLLALTVGGWGIDAVGAQRSLLLLFAAGAVAMAGMALAKEHWADTGVLLAYIYTSETIGVLVAVALIPICMRMCTPAVAATQFTIYMAVGNLGRPLGAMVAAHTAGAGDPVTMYAVFSAIWLAGAALLALVRFPRENRAFTEAAHVLPQAEGIGARVD